MAEAGEGLREGDRVREAAEGGGRGTVRYVGPVDGHRGEYVGVEWDNRARGKHNGVLGGRQYFKLRTVRGGGQGTGEGEVGASFLRAKRLQRGETVGAALRRKYCGDAAEVAAAIAHSNAAAGSGAPLEVCGVEGLVLDSSGLAKLEAAYVPGSLATSAGTQGDLSATVGPLRVLDLSGTLLFEWAEVSAVGRELPALRTLNLSDTALALSAPGSDFDGSLFRSLSTLVLNDCALPWSDAVNLLLGLPQLKELHLSGNGISSLSDPGVAPEHGGLEVLALDDNELSDWADLRCLQGFLRLRELRLGRNRLTEISSPRGEGSFCLAALRALLVPENRLRAWSAVDALDAFPVLEEVRLSGNPVLEGSDHGGRHVVIARISGLRWLNGSAVTERERRESELRYLRTLCYEHGVPTGDLLLELTVSHPRLPALLEEYRESLSAGQAKMCGPGSSLGDSMGKIVLKCVVPGLEKEKSKKLPLSTTLGKLKVLMERLFKLGVAEQEVFWDPSFGGDELVPLDAMAENGDSQDLATLGVRDGATIVLRRIAS